MKIRTTVILFGIFAAALLTFGAFQWLGVQTGDEKKHAERFVFPSLNPLARDAGGSATKSTPPPKAEEFSRIVIERNKTGGKKVEKIEFVRTTAGKATKWQMMQPVKVRTDETAVNGLVTSLMNLEKQKAKDLGRDLGKFGLDAPEMIVTMTRGDKDYVLSIGNTGAATKDPALYATSSESPGKPLLLTKSKVEKLFDPIASFRDKSLISSAFDISGIRLAGSGRPALELTKDKDWTFKEPALGDADSNATDELGRNLAGIRIEKNEDFISDGIDDAKLAQYGLAEDKAAYVFAITHKPIDLKDKPTVDKVIVGKADEAGVKDAEKAKQAALAIESAFVNPVTAAVAYQDRLKQKVEPMHYYARLADDQSIIRISARHLALLQKGADELRAKGLAKIDISKVDAVNLQHQGETLRLRRPDLKAAAEWEMYADQRAKAKTHPQVVQNLLDALVKIEIKDAKAFLDDDGKIKSWFGGETIDLGLDKPQAEVTIWQEGIQRDKDDKPEGTPEPKLKESGNVKPTLKLSIGKKDAKRNVVYVRREALGLKPTVLAVPDPFIFGNVPMGAQQSFAPPPDGRQTLSLTELTSRGYLAYREHQLPSFRLDQIASLEVKRVNGTYLLERGEKKDDQGNPISDWKLKQPVEGQPVPSMADLMATALTGTSADKLINDRVTEKELDETYGLVKSPLLQLIIKTKPEPAKPAEPATKETPKEKPGSTFIYTISKKQPDPAKHPNHYFARVESKPGEGAAPESNQFVFVVPLSYVQSLDMELRNTTALPMETTKPATVSLTWNGQTAEKKPLITKMELALVNEKWEIKSLTENGADAKAKLAKFDGNKVNAFLSYGPQPAFAGPRINPFIFDRFYRHGGTIDPKWGLDPTKSDAPPKLVVEAKYSDGKMRTVILGEQYQASEGSFPSLAGNYYFAATPALPGVVGIVNEFEWRDLVAGFGYFQEAAPKPQQ